MTDCKNLELARQWAADIDADRETLSQDTIDAAADLINGLPDAWVSVDELRKYIADWREGLATAPRGNYESEMLDDLEDMLPAPPAPESAAPRPEDVPEGDVWAVSTPFADGVGYRSAKQSIPWFVTYPGHTEQRTWNVWADEGITLLHRLVPETTEQDDVPEFDPAYTYRDRAADGLPAPLRSMFPGGRVWYIEGPVGDVRATSDGKVVAFGTWQEQPFRIVATPEEMRTLARTLEAAAAHAETEVTDG